MEKMITSGKRKSAVARAVIKIGTGKITMNGRDYKTLQMFERLRIEEPVRIAERILGKMNFDVEIIAKGGGQQGQTEASRLALARAMVRFTNSKELKEAFVDYDRSLIVADVRRKETYKPGDSKARRKRQKSYR
jgi:small subunit ribosomal protein S9